MIKKVKKHCFLGIIYDILSLMKRLKVLFGFIVFMLIGWLIWKGSVVLFGEKRQLSFKGENAILVNDEGFLYQISSDARNVGEFIEKHEIKLEKDDFLYPQKDAALFAGRAIEISRNRSVVIEVDEKRIEHNTFERTVGDALGEAGVKLGRLDKIEPSKLEMVENGEKIIVTRINIEKVAVVKKINFEIMEKNDDKLQWRKEKIEQEGKTGEKIIEYQITYKNGEEVSRETISTKVTKKPITKVIRVGTKIKLGKTHNGWGTWYNQGPHPKLRAKYPFKGDMFAASPWLPLGSYAKVTNKANGKSVIVRINDRGPFGANRIIDLHIPPFKQIASLGAGVIEVKVQEIK